MRTILALTVACWTSLAYAGGEKPAPPGSEAAAPEVPSVKVRELMLRLQGLDEKKPDDLFSAPAGAEKKAAPAVFPQSPNLGGGLDRGAPRDLQSESGRPPIFAPDMMKESSFFVPPDRRKPLLSGVPNGPQGLPGVPGRRLRAPGASKGHIPITDQIGFTGTGIVFKAGW